MVSFKRLPGQGFRLKAGPVKVTMGWDYLRARTSNWIYINPRMVVAQCHGLDFSIEISKEN